MRQVGIIIMSRKFDFKFYASEGIHSIFNHGFMSFAAVCMIVACLLIMGSFTLVAVNLNHMLGDLEAENEFLAYVDESLSEEDARALESKICALPNVSEATFVTKTQAKENYISSYQDTENYDLFEELPDEVFRDRYSIHVTDIETMGTTVELVRQVPGIADTSAMLEIAEGFVVVRNVAGAVAIILVAILLVISLFIIANTIKLATFSRREEIAIMKMVGATNAFIRWPFVFEGLILGLAGALLAFLFQWGIYGLISNAIVQAEGTSLITLIPYSKMALRVMAIFAGTGFVIGVGGSLVAIRKFLQV